MDNKPKLVYTEVIQDFFSAKFPSDAKVTEKCIIAVEAYVNIKWKRHFRIIALIKKRTSHAVFIFKGQKLLNETIQNIHLLEVLPLTLNFKFETDKSKSPNGDFHPVILSTDVLTLLECNSLPSIVNSVYDESNVFNTKQIHLDFNFDNFNSFLNHISNALQFITDDEIYSSFDWLNRFRDEAESVSDITNELTNSESDNESRPRSGRSSRHNLSVYDSIQNQMSTSDIFPVMSDVSNGLVVSLSKISNSVISANNVTNNAVKKSVMDLHRSSFRSISSKGTFDHCQSSPDLINGAMDVVTGCPSEVYSVRSVNDNRQHVYIENKLRQKEDDYCNWEDHTLFVGTWNVNGRIDDSLCLDDWLTPPAETRSPNIYIIGFQEIDLSIGSVALNRGNTSNLEDKWLKLIESSTPFKKHSYHRVCRSRLAGILLTIYVDTRLSKNVPIVEVIANKVPTGMFNVMGNKGAVGISLRAFNSNLCFINCHLAAGESNRLRRDQDFRDIEKNLIFLKDSGKSRAFYEHDLIFLMGDLNYRILNLEATAAKELAYSQNIDRLLENDELLNYSKSVFKRFYEGKIHFIPTYKFDPSTDEYDTSEKNRVPSFCDRIMWFGEHCRILDYSSHMSLKISDHKPVSALFNIGLKKIDPVKRTKVQESIIRGMDLIYNLSLPQAKIDKQEIVFENVHFYEHKQATIPLTNIGHYEFMFNFKEIPGSPKIPDWLTVQPSEGTVKPGENCELIFEIFINANNVSQLNTKEEVQCILVLMLQGGKDYFITVIADLVPTSFGLPLSLLVSLKKPVSAFTRKELYEMCKPYTQRISVPTHGPHAFTTPKEMYVMVDYLLKNINETVEWLRQCPHICLYLGYCKDELFARPGSHSEIQTIREQLDTEGSKADFSNVCVHSVTEALLMFLSSLYFPIIPTELMQECMGVHNNFIGSVKVISKLPLDHQNLFHYLTSFLRKVLEKRSENGTDFGSLGILFVDLIFRPKNLESSEREICSQFIKQFLINDPGKYFR